MHPDVRKLVEVQKVDQEIARVRKDLDSLPREQASREKKLNDLKKAAELKKNVFVEAEMEIRRLEGQVKSSDEEVKKLDGRLNLVKNNAEYQAILFQIDAVKKERSAAESEALQKMELIEGLKATAKEAQGLVAEEEKVYAAFLAEAKVLRAAREAEVAKISVGRADLIAGIPKDLLNRYERMFASRDFVAVAAVENQVCQGCYTQITRNDLAKLMGKSTIVLCGSCQRILYLAE